MPFPDMAVRCEPRYYLATLPHRQCPKIQAFIRWIQDQAQGGILKRDLVYCPRRSWP